MRAHSLLSVTAAASFVLLFSCAAPQSAAAESAEPSATQELALKVKGWDCDG